MGDFEQTSALSAQIFLAIPTYKRTSIRSRWMLLLRLRGSLPRAPPWPPPAGRMGIAAGTWACPDVSAPLGRGQAHRHTEGSGFVNRPYDLDFHTHAPVAAFGTATLIGNEPAQGERLSRLDNPHVSCNERIMLASQSHCH